MPNPERHINTLKSRFFGGGTDDEYAYYAAAEAAGVTGPGAMLAGVAIAQARLTDNLGVTTGAAGGAGLVRVSQLTTATFVQPSGLVEVSTNSLTIIGTNAGALALVQMSIDGGSWTTIGQVPELVRYNFLGAFPSSFFGSMTCRCSATPGQNVRVAITVGHDTATQTLTIPNGTYIVARAS